MQRGLDLVSKQPLRKKKKSEFAYQYQGAEPCLHTQPIEGRIDQVQYDTKIVNEWD